MAGTYRVSAKSGSGSFLENPITRMLGSAGFLFLSGKCHLGMLIGIRV